MKTYKRMGGNENPTTPVWILDQRIDLAVLLICVLTVSCCCSVTKLCLTLCDTKNYNTPGFPVLHYLSKFAQTHVHEMPSNHLILCRPLLLLPLVFPSIRVFCNQSLLRIRWPKGASASVLPVNIQDWFPSGLTGWISLQSKGLPRVFSSTTVRKHQFFSTQPSL